MRMFVASLIAGVCAMGMTAGAAETKVTEFKMKSLDGKDVDLAKYKGKVLLIVNVASKCGATPQYEQLQELHEKYQAQGLAVLGFPCNQFGGQEPGDAAQIAEFCKAKYDVTFDMFQKIDVNGSDASPLYKTLTAHEPDAGPIKWNFEKFVIGKDGEIVARFATRTKPDAPEVLKTIETELAKK
ncbi:MAG: glutathione peroxidase [Planctomycetales bacterium 12-60-4]|nr:MAG: glutathione peroxidase [Planctomycetales bacterium 12-60-4]